VVHEVYGKNGRFLSTFLYTSEAPLTWNASMVIYAFSICKEEMFNFKNKSSSGSQEMDEAVMRER
jgi:hypothetical protein